MLASTAGVLTMQPTILVPVDHSSQSLAGLTYALVSFPDARVTAVHVVDVEYDEYGEVGLASSRNDQLRDSAERILERAVEIASEYGRDIDVSIEWGTPHRSIVSYAVDNDVDHIVMGSHGESPIARPFLGHVTEAVVRRAPTSTTVVPISQSAIEKWDLPGRVLVPIDGSEQALSALDFVVDRFPTARVTIFHAVPRLFEYDVDPAGTYVEELIKTATEQGNSVIDSAKERVDDDDLVLETTVEYGEPARSILEYATENAFDQIVMGSHGRSLPARIVTGSVAETVSRRSTLPVTLVKGKPNDW